MVDLGLKDGANGFLRLADLSEEAKGMHLGTLVHVLVHSLTSKLVKCTLVEQKGESTARQTVQTSLSQITEHTLKPGYYVSGKVTKTFENGIEMSFLGGITGTIFIDHLVKSPKKFKTGEKVQARVISQDVASKTTALTMLPHLMDFTGSQVPIEIGKVYKQVKVEKKLFGSSYLIKLEGSKDGERDFTV